MKKSNIAVLYCLTGGLLGTIGCGYWFWFLRNNQDGFLFYLYLGFFSYLFFGSLFGVFPKIKELEKPRRFDKAGKWTLNTLIVLLWIFCSFLDSNHETLLIVTSNDLKVFFLLSIFLVLFFYSLFYLILLHQPKRRKRKLREYPYTTDDVPWERQTNFHFTQSKQ